MNQPKDTAGAPEHSIIHTPGPWCVKRRFDVYEDTQKPGVGGTYVGTTRNREFVATTRGNGELPESVNLRCEADARLIAAAPDLLEACKRYLDAMDRYGHPDKTDRLMRAAIEKATGEVV